jgi:hypothetical protein
MDRGIIYYPTDKERIIVESLVAFGHSHVAIAEYLDMGIDALKKHFPSELAKGKTSLALTCGRFLVDTVTNTQEKTKDRIQAATYILSRCCGWTEKVDSSALDATAIAIRESVNAVKDALAPKPVNKDVDTNAGGSTE